MSTYLAAWVVVPDDYDSITKKTFAGKDVNYFFQLNRSLSL